MDKNLYKEQTKYQERKLQRFIKILLIYHNEKDE